MRRHLSDLQIAEIRALINSNDRDRKVIARDYNISASTITRIANHTYYKTTSNATRASDIVPTLAIQLDDLKNHIIKLQEFLQYHKN